MELITGMKIHFEELTGMDMGENNIANKCARVVSFLKHNDKTERMAAIFREMETSSKNVADINVAVFLPLLLKYFNEEEVLQDVLQSGSNNPAL